VPVSIQNRLSRRRKPWFVAIFKLQNYVTGQEAGEKYAYLIVSTEMEAHSNKKPTALSQSQYERLT
jgi:hypothetical protein